MSLPRNLRLPLALVLLSGFGISLPDASAQQSPYAQARTGAKESPAAQQAPPSKQAADPSPQPADAPDARLAQRQSPASVRSQTPGALGQPITPGAAPSGHPSAQQQQQPPAPPFQLSPVEQQFVRQILEMWENRSNEVRTFNADFDRLEYNLTWGAADKPMIASKGQLTYAKPDRGSFKINEISRWVKDDPQNSAADAPGQWQVQENEIGEHWVCNGKAIYEYVHRAKQLVVRPIPEEMQGEEIVNGPLPFLFGAKADDLQNRYWIRAKQSSPETIWLEAFPRRQEDAANYRSVDIMLDRKSMLPSALQIHEPDGLSRSVYTFHDSVVNSKLEALFGNLFDEPRLPITGGWKRVVEAGPVPGPQAANPQSVQR